MTSAYPDIEGQLYSRTAPTSMFTEAKARQEASTERESVRIMQTVAGETLDTAKAYTRALVASAQISGSGGDLTGFATTDYVDAAVAGVEVDTSRFADKQWVEDALAAGGTGDATLALSHWCAGTGEDESAQLQAAVDEAVRTKATLVCDVPGVIGLGSTVTMGNLNANSTREAIFFATGTLRVKATTAVSKLLDMRGTFDAGNLTMELDGQNLAEVGIYSYNIGRSRFGSILARRFTATAWAIEALMPEGTNNNNCFTVRDIQVVLCGSKHTTSATVSKAWDGGMTAVSSNPAVSEWTLNTPLPQQMRRYAWMTQVAVMADGRLASVMDVSPDGRTIKIAHENRPNGYSESITLHTSAIHWPYNPDAGAWHVGSVDVSSCPNAASMTVGGYGGGIGSLVMQYNALGLVIPLRASGLDIGHLYTEGIGTWLYASHVNHQTAGTAVSIGAGQKTAGTIQIGDQGIADGGYMTMEGRDRVPSHWRIVGHFGQSAEDVETPGVPFKEQPPTETVTTGPAYAFTKTSGDFNLRIDVGKEDGRVGTVHLRTPAQVESQGATLTLFGETAGHTFKDGGGTSKTVPIPHPGGIVHFWLERAASGSGGKWVVTVTPNVS